MSAADHVDIEVLNELKDIMEDEFDTLINTFIDDSEEKVRQLDAIISGADADALRKTAHSLKGSSLNVSAQSLSELALSLENMGREGHVGVAAREVYASLNAEFQQVKAVLTAYLS